ncbi:CRISPR-associated protein [Chania multitudinisentens RB-25]|uniref:CRISPR-associated protein n=1 Tax=Chania multitudinisentens RB-25 TaxID=1441930 RepID=W0LAN2_9GAMM|nr:type I-F CRISPR-associated protein Csy1 [Chania multitudinisentens]AHG20878.1 CRISPR-associated protein [Chania multitudinisentens RB-25]
MEDKTFSQLIARYIEGRKQPKLEAFDKEAEKRLAGLTDSEQLAVTQQDIAQQRRELEQRYEVRNWLTDAASRAGQISLVTHALKFTHSDAKGSSVFLSTAEGDLAYLATATLRNPALDAVGNAAALDCAKLLQMEYEGESLIAVLDRGDDSPLAALAESDRQLQQWVNGFKQVLTDKQPSSHKLAKQLYFPIGDNEYHLLSPLFSSSLAHAMHQRIADARFSDAAKEIYSAFKAGEWHPAARVSYPNTAVQNIGGTKPQNISYLNSVRGGRTWLLSCAAPSWKIISKPPTRHKSIFHDYGDFSRMAYPIVRELRHYLLSVKDLENTKDIRDSRLAFTDEIIDTLFNYVAMVQDLEVQAGWSAKEDCQLKRSQQLWLDAGRAKDDADFQFEREGGDWQKEIALDFGVWLNRRLQHEELKFGEVERREWSTAKLFKQRLREFEQDLKEGLA